MCIIQGSFNQIRQIFGKLVWQLDRQRGSDSKFLKPMWISCSVRMSKSFEMSTGRIVSLVKTGRSPIIIFIICPSWSLHILLQAYLLTIQRDSKKIYWKSLTIWPFCLTASRIRVCICIIILTCTTFVDHIAAHVQDFVLCSCSCS